MKKADISGLIEPPNLRREGVEAAFTTTDVNIETTSLAEMFNMPEQGVYLPVQKHTSTVHILSQNFKPVTADAVITAEEKVLIGVKVADCVPILLYDPQSRVIGAVHAGWRGTADGILKKALLSMHDRYGTASEDLFIAVGPSIGQCCYEVDEDVREAVCTGHADEGCRRRENGKFFIDLPLLNIRQAISAGVKGANIWRSDECTSCNTNRFSSYRRQGRGAGRQGGFIMMW